MTNIALRAYNREIETRIEKGFLDEAIAHCKHILKTFPMHIETYRLMGKAYLEARRYSDATDIFQRVIASVPDDFVAHVGMSIIRDDEGKLDQATWHMERAFEVQPSNPAIQDELRKLYGRRDGVEPPKVRLTKEALANMYTQGALYGQAIVEIRAVLANDPDRPDLQVMLARAYARDGRKSQAIDLCTSLLKNYPYCFDALRILVDIMSTTDRLDIIGSYRQRVCALDPYAAFASGSVFESGKVADENVELEMLTYEPLQQEGEDHPAWASSLGLTLDSDSQVESLASEVPDEHVREPEPGTISFPDDDGSDRLAPVEGEIPEWMRSSGWKTTDEGVPTDSEIDSTVPEEELIVKADIPDWLKDMAPQEADLTGEISSEQEDSGSEVQKEDLPGVLLDENAQRRSQIEPENFQNEIEGMEIPDWLADIKNADTTLDDLPDLSDGLNGDASFIESVPEIIPISENEKVEIPQTEIDLKKVTPAEETIPVPIKKETTAGFVQLISEGEIAQSEEMGVAKSAPEITEERAVEITDVESGPSESVEQQVSEGKEENNLPDWLQEVVQSTEALSQSSERFDGLTRSVEPSVDDITPSTNLDLQTTSHDNQLEIIDQEITSDKVQEKPSVTTVKLPSEAEKEAAFAWMEGLAARQGASSDELLTKPEERLDVPPDVFLQGEPENEVLSGNLPRLTQIEPILSNPLSESGTQSIPEIVPATFEEEATPVDQDKTQEGNTGDGQNEPANGFDEKNKISDSMPSGQEPQASPKDSTNVNTDVSDWLKEMETKEGILKTDLAPEEELIGEGDSEPLPEWLTEVEKGARASEWISGVDNLLDLEKVVDDIAQNQETTPTPEPAETFLLDKGITQRIGKKEKEVETSSTSEKIIERKPLKITKSSNSTDTTVAPRTELVATGKLPGTGMLSKIPGVNIERGSTSLEKAQKFLEKDDLNNALKEYGYLIKKGQLLEQVTHDLREIIYRYPVEILIWQMLGDAYLRANRLQDALDSYTKAEELLR